ncbi:MAG: site-specific integrase [Lachnospiraceae bacterium]|nr:site-specific integrase [Lachnospiraceae bacterium]
MPKRKNGTGTLILLDNGKYRLVKQVGTLENGRPRRVTVTGTSETDCLRKMKAYEEKLSTCISSISFTKMTVTELCNSHLGEHLDQKNRLKPKSADRRESTIINQIEPYAIGKMQVLSVEPTDVSNHIERLINEDKVSVSSIIKTLNVVNAAYRWAGEQNYTNYNPCTPVMERLKNRLMNLEKRNSSDGVVVVLSNEQVDNLKKYVEQMKDSEPDYRYLTGLSLLLLLNTGIRVGELCGLRWKDWSAKTNTLNICRTRNISKNRNSIEKGEIYIPNENEVKNYHSRTLALNDEATAALEEMYRINTMNGPDDYIMTNRSKKPTNPCNYANCINKIYKKAGLPEDISGAHVLRRTCATMMHDEGCRVEDIAAYLGDTPETIQKHYISMTKKIVAGDEIKNVVNYPRKK